ncbi:MerR family DNA-binding transcriptional regulator [Pseudoalteromonas sp. CO302Y]|uniref:MerR family DNA-binding transcriptional regulator n=1 Tax=unclassified Pseudoalteromonas TaxID=194690 RepID=UPI0010236A3F|nr:MerR family DNA-binding transcriptional regulator [Pseudoalteromonas sp. CO302Y]RZG09565.1 MerR family DNA-binding transcriptional regulator [Pseudoalteromonas sp. CO133X]
MKIGELAKRTGLSASKIRFYEDIGLLKMVERKANGYRSYPKEAEVVLNLIVSGQQAGFSLDELKALLPADLSGWHHAQLIDALKQKVMDIEQLQAKLAENKQRLTEILTEIDAKPDDMDCADNAKRVLSQMGLKNDK